MLDIPIPDDPRIDGNHPFNGTPMRWWSIDYWQLLRPEEWAEKYLRKHNHPVDMKSIQELLQLTLQKAVSTSL